MRALVVEHDEYEVPGAVGRELERRGFELVPFLVQEDRSLPDGNSSFPDPTHFELIVPFGSPWSVHDPAIASWLDPELDMLRKAMASEVPVMGICFGSQALAAAAGGEVRRAPAPEIGWHEVGSVIPQLAGTWFQWHRDVFEVPAGAELLAFNPVGPQVFRVGNSVGIQFHPEVDYDHLSMWMSTGGASALRALGGDPEELLVETKQRDPEVGRRVRGLVGWFLDEIA
ncbi:MAG: gamma-glutamyl-gamma-aminobutyrate hydrolase family protein [Acidimicrobiia bacterium]